MELIGVENVENYLTANRDSEILIGSKNHPKLFLCLDEETRKYIVGSMSNFINHYYPDIDSAIQHMITGVPCIPAN